MLIAEDLIDRCNQDLRFLQILITGNESCCYQFYVESKRQTLEWRSPVFPYPQIMPTDPTSGQQQDTNALFISNSMMHPKFVPEGQTVNTFFYEYLLKWLLLRLHHPQMYRSRKWGLLHANVRLHIENLAELITALHATLSLHSRESNIIYKLHRR